MGNYYDRPRCSLCGEHLMPEEMNAELCQHIDKDDCIRHLRRELQDLRDDLNALRDRQK